MRRHSQPAHGQAHTEMIIVLVLIGLATVVFFSFFGRSVGRAFFCAGQAIARGEGITFSCPGSGGGGGGEQKPGETVVAGGGPAPLPELGGGAGSAPGSGPKQKQGGVSGGGGEAKPGEAVPGGDVPTLPNLGGGAGAVPGGGPQQKQSGVSGGGGEAKPGEPVPGGDVATPPNLGGGASSVPGGGPQQMGSNASGGGGEAKSGEVGLGGEIPILPNLGGEARSASGGARQQGGVSGGGVKPGEVDLATGLPALPEPESKSGSAAGETQPRVPNEVAAGSEQGKAEPIEAAPAGKGPSLPAPSGGSGSASGAAAQQRLADAKELLKSTTKGKDLLKFLDDNRIAIELRSGDGSEYDPTTGKIILNDAKSVEQMALTIAHEGNHGEYDKGGKGANINTDSRDDYVRKMIEEEAVGTVASIEMKKDLQAAGKTITATYPLEKEYDAAHKKAVEDLKKSNPSATAAELDKAGKAAGLDAVRKGFETGKVVASNTRPPVTYPDYYGQEWDDAHRSGKPEAARPEPGAPGGGTAQQRLEEAKKLLGRTKEGADALRWFAGVRQDRGGPGFSKSEPEIKIELMPGTGAIYDRTKRTIYVGDAQSAQEMALGLIQSEMYTVVDHSPLEDSRSDYVTLMVNNALEGTIKRIEVKRELEAQGIKVTATVPYEQEYDLAYKVTYAKELPNDLEHAYRPGMRAKDIYIGPDARSLATSAGQTAAREAFKNGKPLDGKTRQDYVDFFGKRHDEVRAAQAKLDKERDERNRIEHERQAKIDAGRKALVELVNAVDPKSRQADQVIKLLHAFTATFGGAQTQFLTSEAREGLVRLLGPYGFKTVDEVGSFQNEQARLDYALANFAALDERQRERLRTGKALPSDFGINLSITYEEMQAREEQKIPYNMGDGTSIMMPRREAREAHQRAIINHALQQIEQIRNAGPASLVGRIAGCVAEGAGPMDPCGEKGAVIGEMFDTGLAVYGTVKARSNVKSSIENYESGGHVVRGGPGGAGFEPVSGPGVKPADRVVPPPRNNVREVGPDLAKRPVTEPNAAPPPAAKPPPQQQQVQQPGQRLQQQPQQQPAPPKPQRPQQQQLQQPGQRQQQVQQQQSGPKPPPEPPGNQRNTGNPPKQDPNTAQRGNVGGARQGTQVSVADVQRNQATRQRIEATTADRDRAIQTVSVNGNISIDRVLDRLEAGRGDGTLEVVISLNSNRHRGAFLEEPRNKLGPGEQPPGVFRDGNVIRVDPNRISADQRARLEAVATRPSEAPQAPARPQVDARANTQRQVDPRAQTQPQVNPRADTVRVEGQRPQQQQVQQQKTRREKITAEIPRPGAAQGGADQQKTGPITIPGAGNRAQKPDTGAPGKFGPEDVVFGLSQGDPKTGPLAKFAGNALNAARPDQLPISQSARNPTGSLTKAAVNEGIAKETVGAARAVLNQSGGKLRFSLDGFDMKEALTPGSKNFDAVTSIEFRRVLNDAFLRQNVRFYDGKGADVTKEILKLQVPAEPPSQSPSKPGGGGNPPPGPPSQPQSPPKPDAAEKGPQSPPKLDMAKQGKHIVGHSNYIAGRSILSADPFKLAQKAGTGTPVNNVPRGQAGFRERVDFGEVIGEFVQDGVSTPTTVGIIHYAKDGIHIVPAKPKP